MPSFTPDRLAPDSLTPDGLTPGSRSLAACDLGLSVNGATILRALTLALRPGQVTVLLGPNGAGKTSLLGCLAGLQRPTTGSALLDGVDLGAIAPRARARRIGLLPQSGPVHWDLDVATLVELGRLPHRGRPAGMTREDREAVAAAMAATRVESLAGRRVLSLSGGERARVLLARVLAGAPDWLLADEPLAALDPAHALDVLAIMRARAAAGLGVVLVLHELGHALRIADTVVLLHQGMLVAQGPPAAVLTPERLAAVYGIEAAVGAGPGGIPTVIPLARASRPGS